MGTRSFFSAILLGLLALGRPWCDPMPAANAGSVAMTRVPAQSDSQAVTAHSESIAAAYREHAPLALFSIGSLAIGGAFYAIGRGVDGQRASFGAGDRSQFTVAVSVAGLSALLAAGSYFYYVHRAKARAQTDEEWDASLIGAPDGAGGVALGARLTLALPVRR
jgi:hypothetical protein